MNNEISFKTEQPEGLVEVTVGNVQKGDKTFIFSPLMPQLVKWVKIPKKYYGMDVKYMICVLRKKS